MRVLDVGCGTGAITAGIAERVGPGGLVVGLDRDAEHIARASGRWPAMPWLRFEVGDVLTLERVAQFDVVAVARTLQWVESDQLGAALSSLSRALAPGGHLAALDYNHEGHAWAPDPPPELRAFVERFRAWREAHGWHSDVLTVVPALCPQAGLEVVAFWRADEVVVRGSDRFEPASRIWPHVTEAIGPTLAGEGFLGAAELARAVAVIGTWCADRLAEQRMAARVLIAVRPGE